MTPAQYAILAAHIRANTNPDVAAARITLNIVYRTARWAM